MQGFPKHLNTKKDYDNCLSEYPNETKEQLQRLLRDRLAWVTTGVVESGAGITDDTHKVIEQNVGAGDDAKTEKNQMEYIEDSNAEIFRLGFTVAEVEAILAR